MTWVSCAFPSQLVQFHVTGFEEQQFLHWSLSDMIQHLYGLHNLCSGCPSLLSWCPISAAEDEG